MNDDSPRCPECGTIPKPADLRLDEAKARCATCDRDFPIEMNWQMKLAGKLMRLQAEGEAAATAPFVETPDHGRIQIKEQFDGMKYILPVDREGARGAFLMGVFGTAAAVFFRLGRNENVLSLWIGGVSMLALGIFLAYSRKFIVCGTEMLTSTSMSFLTSQKKIRRDQIAEIRLKRKTTKSGDAGGKEVTACLSVLLVDRKEVELTPHHLTIPEVLYLEKELRQRLALNSSLNRPTL